MRRWNTVPERSWDWNTPRDANLFAELIINFSNSTAILGGLMLTNSWPATWKMDQ